MPVTIKKNEVFEFYQYLPQEVRAVVIDEMGPDDRCRFTRCSKSSQKEAKTSKNLVYGLKFDSCWNDATIEVLYGIENRELGYFLKFTNGREGKIMKCMSLENEELWRSDISGNVQVNQFATQCFKDMLHDYQKMIKKLEVKTIIEDLRVRSFRRLEEVRASSAMLASEIFPKLQRPLKYLENFNNCYSSLASCEEVYQVENEIFSQSSGFTNEQFLRLKASKLFINIGELSVENIYDFIHLWQNGKVRNNFEYCTWQLNGSNFNTPKLFNLFKVRFTNQNKLVVEIENDEYPTKTALLIGYRNYPQLVFTLKGKS